MPSIRPLPATALLRRALPVVLVVLVLALLLQAQAGVLRQLLGAAHWHRPLAGVTAAAAAAPAGSGWLAGWAAWRQQRLASSPLIGGHRLPDAARGGHRHDDAGMHAAHRVTGPSVAAAVLDEHDLDHHHHHHHGQLARHHHAPQDPSLVLVDRVAGDGDPLSDLPAGSLLPPLVLAAGLRLPAPVVQAVHWPADHPAAWRDARQRLPERPPRA